MSDERRTAEIFLSVEELKKIARYEMTFRDVRGENSDCEFVCPEGYQYTLWDLKTALQNLKEKNPTVEEFGKDWYAPIAGLEEAFCLDEACGFYEDEKEFRGIITSDEDFFQEIWYEFEDVWEQCSEEERLADILDIDMMLSDLARYVENKKRPILNWNLSKDEMASYIYWFENDERVERATEDELSLARRCVNELCAHGNAQALHLKAYACYGGNRLFACDWETSRDCLLELYRKTDDPQYANTLGYIYYYGRCNGGKPEYEDALYYFGIAAANGLYEGMYKLADMYANGYGCKKSERTARSIYGMVYEDSIKAFRNGHDANFADAAMRMGNVFAQGIGDKKEPTLAYFYYLQAEYAAKLRAEKNDFFGNITVVKKAKKALDETAGRLPDDYFLPGIEMDIPYVFAELAENNNRCMLTRETFANQSVRITGERVPTRSCPTPENILVTFGQIRYCKRTTKVSMIALEPSGVWFKDDADSVRYDFGEFNFDDDQMEFYYDDELVAVLKGAYRFDASR